MCGREIDGGRARERRSVCVRGIVQGVGFRPFVYSLAHRNGLAGWVRNDADGVHIEAEGTPHALDSFVAALSAQAPALAVVESVEWAAEPARGDDGFQIVDSAQGGVPTAHVSPDAATCDACLTELFEPTDRRYRYPFINCTNCGPRFTITRAIPYDRPTTTMATFRMCETCRREYDDPADRRFHAQPNACPVCGPQVRLTRGDGSPTARGAGDPIRQTADLLLSGAVIAIKGLGGYHLACDACNRAAVEALRQRKRRQDRPFAIMVDTIEQARQLCEMCSEEEGLLQSRARPIVLLERRAGAAVPDAVAPRQRTLGVMLPYTPLHHLLLRDAGGPLVMTSGNLTDEPIAYDDGDARDRLGAVVDFMLVHDRPIHIRCDDSVTGVVGGRFYVIRRSRGYSPGAVRVASGFRHPILACGAAMKATFCLARDHHAFLSHHIGDLENYGARRAYREGVRHFEQLFALEPSLVACDLHPDYPSSLYASELEEQGIPVVRVQHHEAHVASCLVDNDRPVEEPIIGVAMDGAGLGADGAIWGGEIWLGSVDSGFARWAHLAYTPLPGGDAAAREPWRMAVSVLLQLMDVEELLTLPLPVVASAGERRIRTIASMMRRAINSPPTSSAGRLFDAVAALLGVQGALRSSYEAQAACELEAVADNSGNPPYPFGIQSAGSGRIIETKPLISGMLADVLRGRPIGAIADAFHTTVAQMIAQACDEARAESGVGAVALSGGTFQNRRLLAQTVDLLEVRKFCVYRHRRVPTNDGGLCLGQAILADRRSA